MRIRKNTYIIDVHANESFYNLHSHMKKMPLIISYLNGMKVSNKGASKKAILFPNPNTAEMMFELYSIPSSHTRLSATIVEYYTKQDKPLVYLFPNGSVYYTDKKINHRIRKDLMYQIKMRETLLER